MSSKTMYVIKDREGGRYATGSTNDEAFRSLRNAELFTRKDLERHLNKRCTVLGQVGSMRRFYENSGRDVCVEVLEIEEGGQLSLDEFEQEE